MFRENFFFGAAVFFCFLHQACSIIAFDCQHRGAVVATIDAYKVQECVKENSADLMLQEKTVQLIQEENFINIKVWHCRIKQLTLVSSCGLNSHASLVKDGLQNNFLEIPRAKCLQIHREGFFSHKGTIIEGLKPNSTVSRSFTAHGVLESDGTCYGTSFSTEMASYTNAVMQISLEISLKDSFALFDTNEDEILFNAGTVCKASDNSCWIPQLGLSFWDISKVADCHSKNVIYQGQATMSSRSNDIEIGNIISVKSEEALFAVKLKARAHLCFQTAFATDHSSLFIIFKNPDFGFFFKNQNRVPLAQNVNLPLYFNSKIHLLGNIVQSELKKIHSNLKFEDCLLARKVIKNKLALARSKPVTYGHLITGQKGYLNVQNGEVFHILKCRPTSVKLRPTKKCYKNLPVIYQNKSTFVEANSRIITSLGHAQPCSQLTPSYFEIDGVWFAFTPSPTKATPPLILQPEKQDFNIKFENMDNFLTAGIYGESTIENFRRYMTFPFQKQRATNFITSRLVETTPTGDYKFSNMFSETDIQFIDERIMKRIKDNFLLFGAYSGAILGIFAIVQAIKACLSIGFNLRVLHKAFGAGFHLLAAFFGSVTTYLLANKSKETDSEGGKSDGAELGDKESTGEVYPNRLLASA